MRADQKAAAARFLDMSADFLAGGYYAGPRAYRFEDDPPPVSATAAFASPAASWLAAPPDEDAEPALAALAGDIAACAACPLAATRKNTVPGEGVCAPLALVLGEAPGADEDAAGRPFVGAAGQLLDKMLAAIGLARNENCFIANVVKCRPPGNRNPEPPEKTACRRYLDRQIELLRPLVILTVGNVPTQALLGTNEGITRLRGRWASCRDARGRNIHVLPTFHPSYLLRDERAKPLAWDDLKKLSRRLATLDARYDARTAELRKKHRI